jgi:hypothetical protein
MASGLGCGDVLIHRRLFMGGGTALTPLLVLLVLIL